MNELIEEMKKKHIPFSQNFGNIGEVEYCNGCKTNQGQLTVTYPCDVVKVVRVYEQQRQKTITVLSTGHHDAAELRDDLLKLL